MHYRDDKRTPPSDLGADTTSQTYRWADVQIKRRRYFVIQVIIGRLQTKLTSFVAHAWRERSMTFQEISSNKSRGTAEKVHSSPSKVPLIIALQQPKLQHL